MELLIIILMVENFGWDRRAYVPAVFLYLWRTYVVGEARNAITHKLDMLINNEARKIAEKAPDIENVEENVNG